MKKILSAFISASLIGAVSITLNSCAPSSPNEPSVPTTLDAVPSSLMLTPTSPAESASLGLSCGCPFALSVSGYGGDTALIHFSVWEVPDSTVHHVTAFVDPASLPAGPGKDSAWIGLATTHDSTSSNPGTHVYDTLHVMVTY